MLLQQAGMSIFQPTVVNGSDGTAIGILASKHKNVEQVLLETVKVATFLVEDRCIVDICKFVGLDCIGNYAITDLGLLAVHAEVQVLQHVLKNIGYLFCTGTGHVIRNV